MSFQIKDTIDRRVYKKVFLGAVSWISNNKFDTRDQEKEVISPVILGNEWETIYRELCDSRSKSMVGIYKKGATFLPKSRNIGQDSAKPLRPSSLIVTEVENIGKTT